MNPDGRESRAGPPRYTAELMKLKELSWIHWLGIVVLTPCILLALTLAWFDTRPVRMPAPPVIERSTLGKLYRVSVYEPVGQAELEALARQEQRAGQVLVIFTYNRGESPGVAKPVARYIWSEGALTRDP